MHNCFQITIFHNASLPTRAYKFTQQYKAIFSKEQSDAPTSTARMSAPLSSDAASNNIQSNNTVTSAPRILHFDIADGTRSSQLMPHDQVDMEHDSKGNKSTGLQCEGRSTARCSESQFKFSSEKSEAEVACASVLSEDEEDVCPTCLEGNTF